MTGKRWRVLDIDVAEGDDLVVIVHGTPCNVEVGAEGITCTVWGAEADEAHAVHRLSWAEVIERAVAL